ncbi:MAG: hypothetical protein ACFUZC_15285 [Chthoniobacteraceae bacterium]
MKRSATPMNGETTSTSGSPVGHGEQFMADRDSRKRRVPGFYVRNGRYYAQLWVPREDVQKTARRFPLVTPEGVPVAKLVEAKTAADILRNDRRE